MNLPEFKIFVVHKKHLIYGLLWKLEAFHERFDPRPIEQKMERLGQPLAGIEQFQGSRGNFGVLLLSKNECGESSSGEFKHLGVLIWIINLVQD